MAEIGPYGDEVCVGTSGAVHAAIGVNPPTPHEAIASRPAATGPDSHCSSHREAMCRSNLAH